MATQQLTVSGAPVVTEIHDLSNKGISGVTAEDFMVQAYVEVPVTGEPPESNRALNYFVTTWVDRNKKLLEDAVHPALVSFLEKEYPDADKEELMSGGAGDLVWDDQVDYMASVTNGKLSFFLDLDLEAEGLPEE